MSAEMNIAIRIAALVVIYALGFIIMERILVGMAKKGKIPLGEETGCFVLAMCTFWPLVFAVSIMRTIILVFYRPLDKAVKKWEKENGLTGGDETQERYYDD